ncbi:MAG: (2Fe-2S)-binding protein [Nevskia sp.]|nr:(2Fe-2S)-binding protein [Nevskia sp.]
MVAITFIEHDGTKHTVDAAVGTSLMEAATTNMLPGIVGMCGGICSCATCHCYLPESWQGKTQPAGPGEQSMLEAVYEPRANSRLGCQVAITEAMDGLEVLLPKEQV